MKVRSLFVSGIFAFSMLFAGGASLVAPSKVSAAAGCDKVNIVECGIDGSTHASRINSFQKIYKTNNNNGHKDLDTVFAWSGASSSEIAAMDSGNTKSGTLYRNGDVKVNGETVATDAWVAARFTNGSGFVKVSDGVWARKTTTSFDRPSRSALVHYNSNGNVDWVVLVDCGNAVKVTPVKKEKPEPKPTPVAKLRCTSLTVVKSGDEERTYTFTATAKAENTNIKHYEFRFGDGTTETVTTTKSTAEVEHTYAANSRSFNARVYVNGTNEQDVTSDACVLTITTPAKVTPVTVEEEEVAPVAEAPAELPEAGAAGLLGIFAGTSALGAIGHRWYTRRRG